MSCSGAQIFRRIPILRVIEEMNEIGNSKKGKILNGKKSLKQTGKNGSKSASNIENLKKLPPRKATKK